MTALALVLLGAGIVAASGVIALLGWRIPRAATLVAVGGAIAGGAVGIAGASFALYEGSRAEQLLAWHVPDGAVRLGLDPLTAFFLVPLFALGAIAAIYGRRYLGAERAAAAAAFNLLIAAMALVLLSRHALLFLVAWEAMTLLAYLLITLEHGDAEVRRAGWAYLIASHVAVMALIALFLVLAQRAGGALDFDAMGAAGGSATVPLLLALVGFGTKAGVVGLHVWLPEAHAAAPSHVSALMSGVLIKLGLYGLLRVMLLVPPPSWFGGLLAALGLGGAVVGISLALYQHDLKRVLAYSSVENIGIALIGIGLGAWARANGDVGLATIAFAGALLHLWNHSAMKGLMFLGAGSVLHGAGTKNIERLGGLFRRMPITGLALIFGAIAISGLPPLNGFVGEWLVYRALAAVGMNAGPASALLALAAIGALALVGGLAALCFVRLVGIVLLGQPRSQGAVDAHESPTAMIAPLVVLAVICVAVACVPGTVVAFHTPVLAMVAGAGAADVQAASAMLVPVVVGNALLAGALALAGAIIAWSVGSAIRTETWGCGYVAPSPRMQYTGRSFAEMIVARLFPRWLRLRESPHRPEGLFPTAADYATNDADPLTRSVYEPLLNRAGDRFARMRWLQQGSLHIYLVYVLATTVLGLVWMRVHDRWWP